MMLKFKFECSLCLLLVLVLVNLLIPISSGSQQTITIYNGTDCQPSALLRTYYDKRNIFLPDWYNIIGSMKLKGLWKLKAVDLSVPETFDAILSSTEDSICYNVPDIIEKRDLGNISLRWVDRIGASDLSKKILYLFSDSNFQGIYDFFEDDRAGPTFQIKSYASFGNTTWILYPDERSPDNRVPLCLGHEDSKNSSEESFSYNAKFSFDGVFVKLDPSGTCRDRVTTTTRNPNGSGVRIPLSIGNILLICMLSLFAITTAKG